MMTLLLSLALAAASGDPAGTATTDAQTAKPVKTKKVCQRIEMSGSNVPKRVCRTVEVPATESDAGNAATEKAAEKATN